MTTDDNRTDCELLTSLLQGSEECLALLYRRRQASVFRFALQMSGSHALAEDVTQEVFLALIRGEAEFDAARGSVKSFLLGIARNLVLRRLKRQQPLVSFEDDSGLAGLIFHPETLDELSRSETIKSVRRAILSLPPHYREVVILCELQEMSYVEVSAVLGCAVGTVRSRLHRARALLVDKLRPASAEDVTEVAPVTKRCFA